VGAKTRSAEPYVLFTFFQIFLNFSVNFEKTNAIILSVWYNTEKIPKREGVIMKTNITGKNYTPSENLKEIIEKKFAKLDKYFSDEITGNIMVIREKDGYKVEATIRAKGTIFRSEVKAHDPYDAVDRIIDKLSSQMTKFKTKLQKKHKGHKEVAFAELPDAEETVEEITVVKKKKFELAPMTVEEAIVQMELLEHSFFVFTNIETDAVNVVYKREDGAYGVLETV